MSWLGGPKPRGRDIARAVLGAALLVGGSSTTRADLLLRPTGLAADGTGAWVVAESTGELRGWSPQSPSLRTVTPRHPGGGGDVERTATGQIYLAGGCGIEIFDDAADHVRCIPLPPGDRVRYLAVDEARQRIYATTEAPGNVRVMTLDGRPLADIDIAGGAHALTGIDVAFDGELWIVDKTASSLHRHTPGGETVTLFAAPGNRLGQLHRPTAIVVLPDRTAWVADTGNHRLQRFDEAGTVLGVVDRGAGMDVHQFTEPVDVERDVTGNLYVVDASNARVTRLGPGGQVQGVWGGRTVDVATPAQPPGLAPVMVYGDLEPWVVERAAANGVETLCLSQPAPEQPWNIREDVAEAKRRGLRVSVSVSFFTLGAEDERWRDRPELFARHRADGDAGRRALSPAIEEVRAWKARHLAEQAAATGIDELFLDGLAYPDPLWGYEPAMVEGFIATTGRDPMATGAPPPDDAPWLAHRAAFIAAFLRELRGELARVGRSDLVVSAFVTADAGLSLRKRVSDWRPWVEEGLVDRLVVGNYSRDLASMERDVRTARALSSGAIPITLMIACWGDCLDTPQLLRRGAEVARGAGVEGIGVYRADAIEALGLWPVVKAINTPPASGDAELQGD